MYNISVRRATETDYALVSKNGKVLEFTSEEEARQWGKDNIEGKSMFVVSWFVSKAMKVIFLDIDGVLNPTHYMNALYKMWKASFKEIKSHDEYGQLFFHQNCEALKKIVDETGAKIVISSTWRMAGESQMKELWKHRNLAGEIIGITPTEKQVVESGEAQYYDMVCRGMEIAHWIKTNNFQGKYVIIDDITDMLKEQQDFFVLTNSYYGLTLKDAQRAIKILNTPNEND
jgi:hypothetical protein